MNGELIIVYGAFDHSILEYSTELEAWNAMKKILFLVLILWLLNLCFCSMEKPTAIDGTMTLHILAIDTTGTLPLNQQLSYSPVPNARVRMKCADYNQSLEFETDENGELVVENLLAAQYEISITKQVPNTNLGEYITTLLSASKTSNLKQQLSGAVDTIKVIKLVTSNLVINEIYYAGVNAGSSTYNLDQFVELYNAGSTTLYLDGLILARLAKNMYYVYTDDVEVVFAYQFPGKGEQFPILPHEIVVIAQDAIDHRKIAPLSPDLSNADWECFNQIGSDIDNASVKNLSLIPGTAPSDFFLNSTGDIVLLIKKYDNSNIRQFGQSLLFNVSEVIDGVKYWDPLNEYKVIQKIIDSGYSGFGIVRASGRSIERHHPETGGPGYDTNNSTFDFVSLFYPTPGWQHTQEEIIPPFN